MSDDEKGKSMGSAEQGYVAVGRAASRQPTEAEIQRGIDAAMRGVIADRWTNPNALRAPDNVKVANAPVVVTAGEGRGWQKEKALESPMPKGSFIEGAVGGMIDAVAPHGSGSPLRRKLGEGKGEG
jgi:hypothetical protein